ncbi:MAG: ABC transporter substrate binding protein [Desulfobacterales bacterium]
MKKQEYMIWFLILLLILPVFIHPLTGRAETLKDIGVIVSLNIKPYAEAVEGIQSVLQENGMRSTVFFLENYPEKQREILKDRIDRDHFQDLVAVGPEASRFIWSEFRNQNMRLLYTMVLHPRQLPEAPDAPCGVSMSIPADVQLMEIAKTLPKIRRVGLLFDPQHNHDFFEVASRYESSTSFSLLPLEVFSRKEIPQVLEKNWEKVDCLWMIPDRTIISESIIAYIIKEALLRKIPVIGYNRFFWESGAVMSFIFDYKELGRQTGNLAAKTLHEKYCPEISPAFQIWLNEGVLRKLGTVYDDKDKKTVKP